jgi:hypothetical protein
MPAPPDRVSLPLSPQSKSSPSPPLSASLLLWAKSRSAPALPVSMSLPPPPTHYRDIGRTADLPIADDDGYDRGPGTPVHGAHRQCSGAAARCRRSGRRRVGIPRLRTSSSSGPACGCVGSSNRSRVELSPTSTGRARKSSSPRRCLATRSSSKLSGAATPISRSPSEPGSRRSAPPRKLRADPRHLQDMRPRRQLRHASPDTRVPDRH